MKEPKLRFPEFSGNWKQINLSDITSKIGSGKTPCGGRKAYVSSGIPLIRSQNVNNNVVNFNDAVFIDKATDEAMKNSRVMTNDVLLNITGASLGRSAVYKEEESANVNQHVCIIRPVEGYNSNFLQLCLASDYGQKQIDFNQAGGGREGLNFQAIGKMSFMIPSNVEQKKIASLFTELDNLIQSAEKELEGYREQKRGMLQKMFPKKGEKVPEIRFPGFTDAWEQRKFSELVIIERGGSPRPIDKFITNDANGLNWVKIGDAPQQGNYITKTAEKIIPEGLSKTREVHPGDLILSNSMSFGKPYIMAIDGCIHDGWLLIRDTNKVFDLKFLCQMLGTEQMLSQYKALAAGSTVNNLNKELVGNTNVKVPNIKEQQQIGKYFHNLDNLITLQQQELDGYKEFKKGLLQQMLC